MMMNNPTFLSRSIDHLGNLGSKLRDLQGYATLAHELIQNADDAHANWMSFDIHRDALILENDGVFSDCEHVEDPQCPWSHDGIHNYQCDFHRFRSVNSGDKRFQEGTTGAFGIGFISVYQLTDRPELISAGRHWILHEEESENERIEVCPGCPKCSEPDLPGTRFIFPFAREEQSPLRQALRADPVSGEVTGRLLDELERSLPLAMLFLKNIKSIEVKERWILLRKFERECEGDTLIISQGSTDNDRVWRILQGNFQSEAELLRLRHPGGIEEKRSPDVMVAVPHEKLSAGLLCACLPTEEVPGLPFHINADFFPSSDRKRVILDDDYQSQWNRKALLAAAQTVAEAVPRLTGMSKPEHFWHLVSTLNDLNLNSRKGNCDRVWAEFWEILDVELRRKAIVRTSSDDWTTVGSGVTILQRREEADNIQVLQGLGIDLVSEDLRPYQSIVRSTGVPVFNIEILCSALTTNGLDKPIDFDDLPPCLASSSGRGALWAEIDILLQRQERTPHAKSADEERLRAVSLVPTVDKGLRPCKDTFRADASTTVSLFAFLGLDIPFLDRTVTAFEPLSYLCNVLEAKDVVQALEEGDLVSIQQRYTEDTLPIRDLITWFANQREQSVNDEDTRRRLAKLPIYPSANHKLRPLTELALPGDFKDHFGLATLVDVEALGGQHEFLLDLGVQKLNFRTYVLEYLSQALDDEALDPVVRNAALTLLANSFDELREDDEVRHKLSSIRLVKCTNGESRRGDECYFPDDIVQEVLGTDANIVDLLDERVASVRELFKWLGVSSVPRLRDIVQTVCRIVDGPCSDTAIAWIQKVVNHLGGRFDDRKDNSVLDPLKRLAWLPARGEMNQWHHPNSLYAPYRAHLFNSQAKILDVPPNSNGDFLEFLGVQINPSPTLVVQHLLYSAEREEPVNMEVYRFLNENADDPAIHKLKSTRCLWLGEAYRSPDDVFWGDHPFGRYRWRLGDSLWNYRSLLGKIGVADTPNHEDALRVLGEIASEFGSASRPLGNEEDAVLMNCWKMCEKAIEQGTLSEQRLGSLGKIRSIPNKGGVLDLPTLLFFDNRVGLASKFREYLSKNVISRPLEAGRAFLAAGVRQLSSAVELDLLQNENPVDDPDTKERLRHRRNEIARVLSCQMASSDTNNALDRLSRLECKSSTSLVIKYRLDVFRPSAESKPEHVHALYQPDSHSMWTTYPNGQLPWAPLARELAIALCPEEDPGLFAAGLKEVVAANTTDDAAKVLDELGFAQLDTTDVEAPPSTEAVQQLGTDDLVNDEEFLPRSFGDESQQDMSPESETENLAMEDTMPQSDITQGRTVLDLEAPEQTSASGADRSGANAQRKGPASRTGGHGTSARRKVQSRGRREFISYVAVQSDDEKESDPDHLSQQERMNLEAKSIQVILKEEPELERTPANNPGFDLTQPGPDGQPIKWVEVKAMKATLDDHPVALTRTQFERAQKHGKAYWLYVVENAATPEHARIVRIRNPAGRARRFTFDHGWRAVSKETNVNPK